MQPLNIRVPTRYEAYLQTPQFGEIRNSVFRRDNYRCVICGSSKDIIPHHLTYVNIFHENICDLITLCNRCHTIYHAIDRRREAIEETYSNRFKEEQEKAEKEREQRYALLEQRDGLLNNLAKKAEETIKTEYASRDYSKDGDLDMCSWSVLNPVIEKMCHHIADQALNCEPLTPSDFGSLTGRIKKRSIMDWFLCRRYELLLRCLDKNMTLENVANKTKFGYKWLCEWYRRDKLEAKLSEEKEINNQ